MSTRTLTIFIGPSLRSADHQALHARAAEQAGGDLEVRILPPVRRGDLLKAVRDGRPGDVVLIVDGEFGQELAVSVLEIRETIAAGLLVLGAGSMGALRAAECDVLGMLGFGWVFRSFRSGALESDAEVALMFDPLSFQPITLPLVNVRWVARRLNEDGALSGLAEREAVRAAARLHFRSRTLDELDTAWRNVTALTPEARATLLDLLDPAHDGRHDRKRLDALEAVGIAHQLARPGRNSPLVPLRLPELVRS
ncbi:TfuA-like protein [Streptacidiphilus carbonis]|jgi:TfuA protein|uniref:TfuA-like protein n=1 Tax=Streptacidiphilus carbonis TaxID=105422 RepID=UPI0006943E77|nr:TfuA-like protein [Streptacidiphilus carbonis]